MPILFENSMIVGRKEKVVWGWVGVGVVEKKRKEKKINFADFQKKKKSFFIV